VFERQSVTAESSTRKILSQVEFFGEKYIATKIKINTSLSENIF